MTLFLAFRNLFRNTRRTIGVLLTIALGGGALFSFEGFIKGVLGQYRDSTIHSHYGHGQIHTQGYRETVYQKPWEHWISNDQQLTTFLTSLTCVKDVFPRVSFSGLLSNGHVTVGGSGQGVEATKEASFFHSLSIVQGETLLSQQNGILLGEGLARALDVKAGDEVTLLVNATDGSTSESQLQVAGIFHTGSADFDNRMFRIQLSKAKQLLKTSRVELISIGLNKLEDWDFVEAKVKSAFPELEAASFAKLDEIYYQHSVNWLNAQFRVVQVIILSILLLGIFNTISSAILERKQEIGNLRANGESILDVMKLILTEGALLGTIGAFLGIASSFTTLKLFLDEGIEMPPGPGLTNHFYATFSFEWSMVLSTFALSLLAAVLASFLAGLRVAKMPIAKALRAY